MTTYLRATCLVAVLGAPLVATAETFIEPVAGIAIPLADEDYERVSESSPKLGLRVGSLLERGIGPELAFDFTPVSDDYDIPFTEIDIQRFRLQLGGRFGQRVGERAFVFGRVAAGVDLVRVHGEVDALNVEFGETDAGIAAEIAGGVLVNLGSVAVGAQLGVPLAFHFDEDDANDDDDLDLDYTGVDLDILFAVTVKL